MWEFGAIKASHGYDEVIDDISKFPGARWFKGASLNFAENLLRHRDEHLAFIFKGETQKSAQMTYAEVYSSVARLARSLREMGVTSGDRVCAYMPNLIETTMAMLAATSIGATWASCGAELGTQAALDRLGQIEPNLIVSVKLSRKFCLRLMGTSTKISPSTFYPKQRKSLKESPRWKR
jgi:acetoacetyl-CoA synthetase